MSTIHRLFLVVILSIPVCAMPFLAQGQMGELGNVVAGLSLTIWLVLSATGLGAVVQTWSRCERHESRLMQLTMNLTVGWAVLTIALLGLASARLLCPVAVVCTVLLLGTTVGVGIGCRSSGLDLWMAMPWGRLIGLHCRRRLHWFAGVAAFLLILTTGVWTLAPPFDWDAEMYHLPLAEHFVKEGGIATHPDDQLLNYPGQMHLWYAMGLTIGTDRFPAMLMLLATVTLSIMAAEFASQRFGTRTGIWTFLVFWSGPIVTLVAATPRVDPACGLFSFAAFVWIAPVLFDKRSLDYRAAFGAGVFFGMAAGIKYIGLVGWATLGCWFVVSFLTSSRLRTLHTFRAGIVIVAAALCVTAPWWVRNVVVWKNPLYPKFAETVGESIAETVSSGSQMSQVSPSLLRRSYDIFWNPSRSNGPPHQFPHYLFIAVVILPLLPIKRSIVIVACVSATYWCLTLTLTAMQRHLFPVFPMLSMLVGYILAWAETRQSLVRFAPVVATTLVTLSLLLPHRLYHTPTLWSYLTGQISERGFSLTVSPSLNEAIEWFDGHSRHNGKILMCWEARTYRVQQRCIGDPAWKNWAELVDRAEADTEATRQWFDTQDIEYVLINLGALRYHVDIDRTHTQDQLRRVQKQRNALEKSLLQPVFEGKAVTVYRILR